MLTLVILVLQGELAKNFQLSSLKVVQLAIIALQALYQLLLVQLLKEEEDAPEETTALNQVQPKFLAQQENTALMMDNLNQQVLARLDISVSAQPTSKIQQTESQEEFAKWAITALKELPQKLLAQ